MRGVLAQMTVRVRGLGLVGEAIVARLRKPGERLRSDLRGVGGMSRTSQSAQVPEPISRRFPAVPEQVRSARGFVRGLVGDEHPRRDDVLLVTSELASNAVEHGGRRAGAGQEFMVSVTFVPGGVVVAVWDGGSAGIPRVKAFEEDSTSGRGLALVESVSRRWGFHRDPAGTVVWAELDGQGHEGR